jgi:hypothetical protein
MVGEDEPAAAQFAEPIAQSVEQGGERRASHHACKPRAPAR